jgi:hypothetical protein
LSYILRAGPREQPKGTFHVMADPGERVKSAQF